MSRPLLEDLASGSVGYQLAGDGWWSTLGEIPYCRLYLATLTAPYNYNESAKLILPQEAEQEDHATGQPRRGRYPQASLCSLHPQRTFSCEAAPHRAEQ